MTSKEWVDLIKEQFDTTTRTAREMYRAMTEKYKVCVKAQRPKIGVWRHEESESSNQN